MHGVPASRVEQDAFSGEKPIAVARAADALDHAACFVCERKLQSRLNHCRALARSRVANHDVPRQLIQRRVACGLAQARGFDRFYRLAHARVDGVGVRLVIERQTTLFGITRVVYRLLNAACCTSRQQVADNPHNQPDGQHRRENQTGIHQPNLKRFGTQKQESCKCREAQHAEHPHVYQESPKSVHR